MTQEQWNGLKYFKPTENWGDPGLMNFDLLKELDAFRDYVGTPIVVTRGTQGVGVKDSQHPSGNAVDVMFPQAGLYKLPDLMLTAMRFTGFKGIGIYSDWRIGGIRQGGLHLDVRPANIRAQWIGVKVNGSTQYIELSSENLRKYFFPVQVI